MQPDAVELLPHRASDGGQQLCEAVRGRWNGRGGGSERMVAAAGGATVRGWWLRQTCVVRVKVPREEIDWRPARCNGETVILLMLSLHHH